MLKSMWKRLRRVVARRQQPYNLDNRDSATWHLRTDIACQLVCDARIVQKGRAVQVADFGCGDQKVRRRLAALNIEAVYSGFDVFPLSSDVRQLDLNVQEPDGQYEVAFLLGVLEYLQHPAVVLRALLGHTKFLVVSYTIADSGAYTPREVNSNGWLHHLTKAALETEFLALGARVVGSNVFDDGKVAIWLLESSSYPKS